MGAVPDRTGAETDTLPPVQENAGSIAYPRFVSYNGGYFDAGISPQIDPSPTGVELDFRIPSDFNTIISDGEAYRIVLGWMRDPNIIISLSGTSHYPYGFADPRSSQWRAGNQFQQNHTYRATFSVRDADNFDFYVQDISGGQTIVAVGVYGMTGMFASNPTLYLGYPPDDVLSAVITGVVNQRVAAEGFELVNLQTANLGPTGITLSNSTVAANAPARTLVGDVVIAHARPEALPLAHYMGEGPEGTADNNFVVENNKVYTTKPLTAGAYPIWIGASDNWQLKFLEPDTEPNFTITVA